MRDRLLRSVIAILMVSLALPSAAPAEVTTPGPVYRKACGLGPDRPAAGLTPLADSVADADTLPASPFTGTVHAQGESDLFAVPLTPGSRLEVSIEAADGVFDLYLFGPGTTVLDAATAVAHASLGGYPRTIAYDVPTDVGGTYYLEVYAWEGSGSYSVQYDIATAGERARTDIPAAQAVATPVDTTVTLADVLQANRIVKFYAGAGSRIRVDLAGPVSADYDLLLYAPGTASVLPSSVQPLSSAMGPTANENLVYDVPSGGGGTYYLEVLRFSGSGSAALQITSSATPPAPSVERIAGTDRYATAVAISREAFPAGSESVVICSGRSFPDGLAAASLAGALDGPILLSAPDTLPDAVGLELQRLRANEIYIVGGSRAVGYEAERRIALFRPGASIVRVAGATRYETAGEVADKVHELLGVRPDSLFLASGESFPDALALSPLAFSTHTPIILTAKASLPEASSAAIARMRGSTSRTVDITIAGGLAAVSDAAAQSARIAAGGSVERASGADRYQTALAVAELAIDRGWAGPEALAIASGVNFPDALGGSPLPGAHAGVLLLCPVSALGTATEDYVKSHDFAIESCWALGGTLAVTEGVVREVDDLLPATASW